MRRVGLVAVVALAFAGVITVSGLATTNAPPVTVLKPLAATKPTPSTGQKAVALVRANSNTNQTASPFKSEVAWVAQWRGDRWWTLGLFTSDTGVRFVVDASVERGKVYTYIDYLDRPSASWVRATAKRWHLKTLYTRLTPDAAIQAAEKDTIDSTQYTVLGAAAKLATDSAKRVGWYFAVYAQAASGSKVVLVVTGLSGNPVEEGNYVDGYGFGGQPELHTSVPLNLSDWVRAVAKSHGWTPSNL